MTSMWLFEPRLHDGHGREKAVARARNGAPLPRRTPSFRFPPRSASPALCPCGHEASFRRRASSFVVVVARCVRGTSSRSASAACGVRGVRATQQRGSRQCDSAEHAAERQQEAVR